MKKITLHRHPLTIISFAVGFSFLIGIILSLTGLDSSSVILVVGSIFFGVMAIELSLFFFPPIRPQHVNDAAATLAQVNEQLRQEILARQQIERTLRENETRLLAAQRMAQLGWWRWDIRTNEVDWSDQVFEIFGLPKSTLVDFEFYQNLLHPEDVEIVLQTIQNTLESDSSAYVVEHRLIRQDGEIRYVVGRGQLYRSETGEPLELVGAVQDITERRQAEDELTRERNLLRTLIDILPDYIFVKDTKGRFILTNITTARRFGAATGDELVGKTDFDFLPKKVAAQFHAAEQELIHSGQEMIDREELNIDEAGNKSWFLATKIPFRDSHDQIIGLVGIARDITDRKQSEEMLRQAKDAAEIANRSKSLFLSNMTHELRTPMNGVLGMTSLLLDTELDAEQLDLVNTIRNSGDTLLALINDILDFSKIEANKLELEQVSFDVRTSIEETLDLVTPKAAEKGLNLAYFMDASVPCWIIQDATRVRQILANLLSNAVKFTAQGEVVVSVQAQPLSGEKYKLTFAVKDTGIGIPADRKDRLFQSFSQIDASTTRRFGGTGLGLAISKRLSEMMGGTMWVESEAGQGSTFYFNIVAEKAETELATFEPDLVTLRNKHVLVVEENPTNRRFIEHHLNAWQVSSVVVRRLEDENLAGEVFDAMILDLTMAKTDSLGVLEALQRQYPNLPIVVLITLGERLAGHHSTKHLTTVTKPIRPSQLHDALITAIDGQTTMGRNVRRAQKFDEEMGRRHPLKILLAEDNLVNQKVALGLLQKLGYRADVAANGFEVLEALSRQSYDAILMDVNMPEMDGLTATQWIQAECPPQAQPHIIAMTANAMQGDREQCLAAGMDDYVSKPIRVEALMEALGQVSPSSEKAKEMTNGGDPVQSGPSSVFETVDLTVLDELEILMGEAGAETVAELIDLYLADSLRLLTELQVGMEQGDAKKVRRAAHTLKSGAASIGAAEFSELCQQLENLGHSGNLATASDKIALILDHYEQVKTRLTAELQKRNECLSTTAIRPPG